MFRSWNPPNRFDAREIEWDEPPPPPRLQVQHDASKGVLQHNDSPDIGFDWSVNPYRGCTHACAYCYARPTHEYLGLGAGSDFERVIVAKDRAPDLLEAALRRPSWKGERIVLSGVTDCYQPIERRLLLTRGCVDVLARFQNPLGIITRSPLVTRDLDLLAPLAAIGAATVSISLPLIDADLVAALEPGAPPPSARLRAMRALADAGVPVGVSVSPVIPGLGDRQIPAVLQAARDHGATFAWKIPLRLPGAVAAVFLARLRDRLPGRAAAVEARIRRLRDGQLNDPRFGHRMQAGGGSWDATIALFELWHKKLGYGAPPPMPDPSPFRVPGQGRQQALFG
ncbi:MAG: radical SAM protein [Alphaproteobacteria bacterium]|nr:radical SAM protein [Alphaproteobacteria bacterium]